MALKVDQDEEKLENYVGRTVKKFFAGFGFFNGKVISFDRGCSFFKIKYDDGDREELELKELKEILVEVEKVQPSAEKPKTRRGRKRRRDSPDRHGIRRARTNPGSEEIDLPQKRVDNFVKKEGKAEGYIPLQVGDVKVLADVKQELVKDSVKEEVNEERVYQEDCNLPELSVHGSRNISEENRVLLDPPVAKGSDENTMSKRKELVPLAPTSPPSCPFKQNGVIHEFHPPSLQVKPVVDELPHAGDAQVVRKVCSETAQSKDVANLSSSWPFKPLETDCKPGGNVDSEKDDKLATDSGLKDEFSDFGSMVLSLPPSSRNLAGLDHCILDLFQVYSFLRSFSSVIFLSPFTLEEFAFALALTDACSMVDCVHLSLLQTLRRHLERLSKSGSKSATFTLRLTDWSLLDCVTWPSYLIPFLLTQGFAFDRSQSFAQRALSSKEYYKLPVATKLMILSFLCDKVLDTGEARAELTRRASFEQDPELTDSKGVWQKKQEKNLKEGNIPEAGPENDPLGRLRTGQGNGAEQSGNCIHFNSAHSSFSSVRVGRHLDEDGNLDECVLCAMDGNLICCDGCPAAFHSRCVGVTKQGLPPGDWFCPECRADKQDPTGACVSKGVRGGDLVVVSSDGHLLFTTCGYLMITEAGADRQTVHRYYNLLDVPKLSKFLEDAGPRYVQLQCAVQQLCLPKENTTIIPPVDTPIADPKASSSAPTLSLVESSDGKRQLPVVEKGSGDQGATVNSLELNSEIVVEHGKMVPSALSSNVQQENVLREQKTCLLTTGLDTENSSSSAVKCISEFKTSDDQLKENPCIIAGPSSVGQGLREEEEKQGTVFQVEKENLFLHKPNHVKGGYVINTDGLGSITCGSKTDSTIQPSTEVSRSQAVELTSAHQSGNQALNSLETMTNGRGPSTILSCLNVHQTVLDVQVRSSAGMDIDFECLTKDSPALRINLSTGRQAEELKVLCPDSGKPVPNFDGSAGKSDKDGDYLLKMTQIHASQYTNKYVNCDFVATAAFNLAVITGGVDDLVENKSGNHQKAKPTSAADQLKAFTQACAHFFWPSSKKRGMDLSKEKCGWCINCRSSIRRGCLLTQVIGQLAGGAAIVVGGIRLTKSGTGHYPAVSAYMLYMEENLRGLLRGLWESPGHKKSWRKSVEQGKSLADVKLALLQMESCLRKTALSADWDKVEEDAPESIASSNGIVVGSAAVLSKKTPAKKRGRPSVIIKSPTGLSYDGACFGVDWWRGGRLSRQVYNWESLPRTVIKRAGRQGGFKEIPELIYNKSSDLPRRTRQFAWRTRVEKATSIAQVAVEVRYFDTFIKWNDIISPLEASTTHTIKGSIESDPVLRKAEILLKSEESGTVKYLLNFPTDPDETAVSVNSNQQEETPTNCSGGSSEKPIKKKQLSVSTKDSLKETPKEEVWTPEKDVPLFLLKRFEEKARIASHSNLPKPLKKGKVLAVTHEKKSSFWKRLCSPSATGSPSKKLPKWVCGHCFRFCPESQSVSCQRCTGKFHRNCTQVEDAINDRQKVPVCKTCIKLRLGQRMRKPTYKLLVLQSHLGDGSPGACNGDILAPVSMDAPIKDGEKPLRKRGRPKDSGKLQRKKKKLLVGTGSQEESEPTFGQKRWGRKKLKGSTSSLSVSELASQLVEDVAKNGKKQHGKKKRRFNLTESDHVLSNEQDQTEPKKKRGRKKKIVQVESPKEISFSPEARRTSGRIRNNTSTNLPPTLQAPVHLERESGIVGLKLGKLSPSARYLQDDPSPMSKTRSGRQKVGSAAGTRSEGSGNIAKLPVRQKRLKIIFSGAAVAPLDVNNSVPLGTQKRKSGNGLDYGCKSSRSEADIQTFKRERLILPSDAGYALGQPPVCNLCSEKYAPGQLYVSCEYCKGWYHGAPVGLNAIDAEFLVGFKCHRCRKCRAPSCSGSRKTLGLTRIRGIDFGEVIDAENMSLTEATHSVMMSQSPWMNAEDKELSASGELKGFSDFDVTITEATGNDNLDHGGTLSHDFDISDLVLPCDSQLELTPLPFESDQVSMWGGNGTAQHELPIFSVPQADPSARSAPAMSFTELLASEEDYFEGVAGPGLSLNAEWTGRLYGIEKVVASCKSAEPGLACTDNGIPQVPLPFKMSVNDSEADQYAGVAKG